MEKSTKMLKIQKKYKKKCKKFKTLNVPLEFDNEVPL